MKDLNSNIISVGKILPNAPLQLSDIDTTSFEAVGEGVFQYTMYLPNPTEEEISMFRNNPIDVRCYSHKGKSVVYFSLGELLTEVAFNPTLYDDNRMDVTFTKAHFKFIMTLVDSSTMYVKSIRIVELAEDVTSTLKKVWLEFISADISPMEYLVWVTNFIYRRNKLNLYKKAKKLGIINGGVLTENFISFGE